MLGLTNLVWISMEDTVFQRLQQEIDQLIERCNQLHQENQRLLDREQNWKTERAQLKQNHNATEQKIEAMIQRLRALEQE